MRQLDALCAPLRSSFSVPLFYTFSHSLSHALSHTHITLAGLHPMGHCIRVRESVLELAKSLLRMCEGRAAAGTDRVKVVVPQDLAA